MPEYEAHLAGAGISVPLPMSTETFIKKDRMWRELHGVPEEIIEQSKNFCYSSGIKNRYMCHPFFWNDDVTEEQKKNAVGIPKENIFLPEEKFDPAYYKRMTVYRETCVALAVDAARKALENWGGDKGTITHVLSTCTSGWNEPGIAISVINRLGLPDNCQKAELNFNGCFCGATCLRLARNIIRSGLSNAVLVVAVEVPSTHITPLSIDAESLVAQALFADGASAIVVAREGSWKFTQSGMSVVPESEHLLGLRPPSNPDEKSYRMTLNKGVGAKLYEYFHTDKGIALLQNMINGMGMKGDEKSALCIHPGGPRILDTMTKVFTELGWRSAAMESSYQSFQTYGNLGAAAMLFILSRRLLNNDINEDKLISMAFGPGITVEWATYERAKPKSAVAQQLEGVTNFLKTYWWVIVLVLARVAFSVYGKELKF